MHISFFKSNGTHVVSTQVLGDLKNEAVRCALDFESIHDRWKFSFELHVDDGTNDLGNLASGGAEATCRKSNAVSYVGDSKGHD